MSPAEGLTLWSEVASDLEGTTLVEASALPTGELGLTFQMDDRGQVRIVGLALDRRGVQSLRHALTAHLIATAPEPELQ